jgi:hypothetical protein
MLFRQILENAPFDPDKIEAVCQVRKLTFSRLDNVEYISQFIREHIAMMTDVDVRQFFPRQTSEDSSGRNYHELILTCNTELAEAVELDIYEEEVVQSIERMLEEAIDHLKANKRLIDLTISNEFKNARRFYTLMKSTENFETFKALQIDRVREFKQALDDFGQFMNKVNSKYSKANVIHAISKATVSTLLQGLEVI